VSWYACSIAGDEAALSPLLGALEENCMAAKVENGGVWYGDAMLMRADDAARHISVELSDHVRQTVIFMACSSMHLQVLRERKVPVHSYTL
jgi:hypothetical protein